MYVEEGENTEIFNRYSNKIIQISKYFIIYDECYNVVIKNAYFVNEFGILIAPSSLLLTSINIL